MPLGLEPLFMDIHIIQIFRSNFGNKFLPYQKLIFSLAYDDLNGFADPNEKLSTHRDNSTRYVNFNNFLMFNRYLAPRYPFFMA